ncbi:hypothetical protein M8C11_23470 [Micromonospora sp. CPM1]|nr:hypothetical protein [Micromonospora sp. CPM1]
MGDSHDRIELLDGSLIVGPASNSLRLHRLDDAHYVEDAVAKAGETLCVTEPFRWATDPSTLR